MELIASDQDKVSSSMGNRVERARVDGKVRQGSIQQSRRESTNAWVRLVLMDTKNCVDHLRYILEVKIELTMDSVQAGIQRK